MACNGCNDRCNDAAATAATVFATIRAPMQKERMTVAAIRE